MTPPQLEAEFKGLSEEEQIAICNVAAICFGLKPAPPMSLRCDIAAVDRKRMGALYDNVNGEPDLMESEDA